MLWTGSHSHSSLFHVVGLATEKARLLKSFFFA